MKVTSCRWGALAGAAAVAGVALYLACRTRESAPAFDEEGILAEAIVRGAGDLFGAGLGLTAGLSSAAHGSARATVGFFPEVTRFPAFVGREFPAPPGERIVYGVRLRGITAGTIELEVVGVEPRDGARCAVVQMTMRSTNPLLEKLFPVRETTRLWVDIAGTFSRGYETSRRHGSVSELDEQAFDYVAGISRHTRTRPDKTRTGEIVLPGPVQDSVSWIYYARACLAAGDRRVRLTMAQRGDLWVADLALRTEGGTGKLLLDEIDLGRRGKVKAAAAESGADLGGVFGRTGGESGSGLWFDPVTGLLVRARVRAPVGEMELVLLEVEGGPAPWPVTTGAGAGGR